MSFMTSQRFRSFSSTAFILHSENSVTHTFINKITFYFHYLVDKTVKTFVPDPQARECVAEDRLHGNAQATRMFSATKLTKMAKSMCVTL